MDLKHNKKGPKRKGSSLGSRFSDSDILLAISIPLDRGDGEDEGRGTASSPVGVASTAMIDRSMGWGGHRRSSSGSSLSSGGSFVSGRSGRSGAKWQNGQGKSGTKWKKGKKGPEKSGTKID